MEGEKLERRKRDFENGRDMEEREKKNMFRKVQGRYIDKLVHTLNPLLQVHV